MVLGFPLEHEWLVPKQELGNQQNLMVEQASSLFIGTGKMPVPLSLLIPTNFQD
jgi:hypothetical protein